jgi:hypothetical protein
MSQHARAGALDVAFFIREMVESYPKMHASLLEQLRDTFHALQSTRVCTTVLWVLAEYSKDVADINAALDVILASLGPPPFAKDGAGGAPRPADRMFSVQTRLMRFPWFMAYCSPGANITSQAPCSIACPSACACCATATSCRCRLRCFAHDFD